MQYLRERFGEPTERTWRDEMGDEFKDCCPSLSYENRLYGFGICIAIGALLSALSTIFLITFKFVQFATFYSLGSLVGLLSTLFLVGPLRQLKMMFTKHRWLITTVYLLLIGLTLFVGLYRNSKDKKQGLRILGILLLVCLQFIAALWYSLSYIPYARKMVRKTLGPCIDCIC